MVKPFSTITDIDDIPFYTFADVIGSTVQQKKVIHVSNTTNPLSALVQARNNLGLGLLQGNNEGQSASQTSKVNLVSMPFLPKNSALWHCSYNHIGIHPTF